MPLYFSYGSNMNAANMAQRCPRSKPLGQGKLMRHGFVIMQAGYASVVRTPNGCVHGLLWDLALSDVPALDRYEGPLYDKVLQPIIRASGGAVQAMLYIGRGAAGGKASEDYADEVLNAATALAFPAAYLASLHHAFGRPEPKSENPRPKVTPRFASPFDRR